MVYRVSSCAESLLSFEPLAQAQHCQHQALLATSSHISLDFSLGCALGANLRCLKRASNSEISGHAAALRYVQGRNLGSLPRIARRSQKQRKRPA